MSLTRARASALFLFAAVLTVSGQQSSPLNRPWPPDVQKVSPDSPALSPAEALKTFYMPPGYKIELVASEPLIQDPIVMDWDRQGRIWAVEMPGFVPNLQAPEPYMEPIGKVVVLEDVDKDGVMDKRTVFADGLVLPRALKVLDRGILVGEPPNAWLMRDTNGDLKMDTKESITDLYGRREARVEQNTNDFYWGMDNWMHTANADSFLRLKNGKFEVRQTLMRGEWGVTQDDAGRIYRNTNESSVHVDYVPTPYFMRNPALVRTRGSYEALRDEANAVNVVWPVRPNPGTNRAYQFGIDRPDGTLHRFTAVCAPQIYRGDRLPAELYGNMFVAEPAANLVSRIAIEDDGRMLRARKAYEKGEFLASTDERFRPVWLSNAPDGTLYIVDMYRGVIQQRADITEYLRDHIVKHKLEQPNGLGRIYRVVHETTKRDTASTAAQLTGAQLVERLSHPNGWWRDAAQRLLVERADKSVARGLTQLAGTSKDWRTRVHALVDPRRSRRDRAGHGSDGARRSVQGSASVRDPHCRTMAWRGEQPGAGGGAETAGRQGMAGASSAGGVTRRDDRSIARSSGGDAPRSEWRRSDHARRGAERFAWQRARGARAAAAGRGRCDAAARSRDHDDLGDRGARRAGGSRDQAARRDRR